MLHNTDHSQEAFIPMNFVRLLPVFISFLLISAHFQRAGYSLIAILCLLAPGLLFFTNRWSPRILQTLLILAAIEWARTLVHLVQLRLEFGMDWGRLAIILGCVTLWTAASALIFQHRDIRRKYSLTGESKT